MKAFDLPTMTVSEIVARIAPTATDEQRTRILRQIRHWTMAGVLSPEGEIHSGPGVHRKYDDESIYIAVVLVELARWQIPVGILQQIGKFLTRDQFLSDKEMARNWESAQAGEPITMLVAMIDADSPLAREGLTGTIDVNLAPSDGTVPYVDDAASQILINLTRLFSRLEG